MRKKRIYQSWALIAIASIGIAALAMTISNQGSAATDETEFDQSGHVVRSTTPEEKENLQAGISSIYTKHGVFQRIEQEYPMPESQIARNKESITAETKQIVLDYGCFLKE